MLEKYKETDFILTTVPLELDTATPIIKISPFFTKEDFLTLSSVISKQMTPAPLKKEAALLDADLFFIEQAESDKDQILKKMIHQLYACGYIDSFPAFYASVIERENLYSTVFDHIWMPHPMRGLSKTTVVAIALIEHAKEIQMIFLCAINPKETPRFQELYRKISRIMDEPSLFDSLHHARSFSAFATLFESL